MGDLRLDAHKQVRSDGYPARTRLCLLFIAPILRKLNTVTAYCPNLAHVTWPVRYEPEMMSDSSQLKFVCFVYYIYISSPS